jgi:hypothetical protein
VHGSTVYGAKDANPVKQLIQFISYQHLHNGLLDYPDSPFSMDFHPLIHMRHIHVPFLRQKHAGMTSLFFQDQKNIIFLPTDSAEDPYLFHHTYQDFSTVN